MRNVKIREVCEHLFLVNTGICCHETVIMFMQSVYVDLFTNITQHKHFYHWLFTMKAVGNKSLFSIG